MSKDNIKDNSGIKCRTILWHLTFIGMAVNYMIRININMTIVAMVKPRISGVGSSQVVAECLRTSHMSFTEMNETAENLINESEIRATVKSLNRIYTVPPPPPPVKNENETVTAEPSEITKIAANDVSYERKFMRYFGIKFAEDGFSWNEYEQGLALGSFYWLHWVTQVPGGLLAAKYGGKVVYGVANLVAALLCMVMPLASYLSFDILLLLRIVQGLVVGLAWPAMHTMTASWIPPNERSWFVTAYLGSSFGVFINYPLFGSIIAASCWENVFHFCGIFGTIWYIGWLYFVYDSPAEHPRISEEEREYIESSLGNTKQKKNMPTPWMEILTCKHVWFLVIAQFGGIWGLFTFMTQAPTYLKYIHGLDIKMLGFLSGLPHLLRCIVAFLVSFIADYLLKKGKMSRTNVRKMGTALCTLVNGILIIGLALSGCNTTLAVLLLSLSVGVHGAVSTGPLSAAVDLSPNFAGVILGINGMIGVVPGFISPIVVGLLTLDNQTQKQWEYVFFITAALLIVSGFPFLLFGSSKVQSWNTSKVNQEEDENSVEMKNFIGEKSKINSEEEDIEDDVVVLKRNSFLEPILEDQRSQYDNLDGDEKVNNSR